MAAGQKYNKTLNYDEHNVKTPAFYDPNLDEWLMASANVVKTEGGVFVFQKGTDDGKAKVLAELSGSYVGYSTDTKPTISNYTPGTEITFLELDTGDVYVYDGTDWVVLA